VERLAETWPSSITRRFHLTWSSGETFAGEGHLQSGIREPGMLGHVQGGKECSAEIFL
jgi:hypothetical protein